MLTNHRADRIAQTDDKILIAFKVDVFIDEQLKRLAGLSSRERKRAGGIFIVTLLSGAAIVGFVINRSLPAGVTASSNRNCQRPEIFLDGIVELAELHCGRSALWW